ncbi:hypothetical protein RN001_011014 [Aquatica leii]|uniref:Retrovirus-related Pol polyprotein from transposon TNT 1-94 n=1 Tax=Aquatica leii TaxID=1421715 RepID=A0AAN7QHV9_9COLE|nr:hypothetical protein RN001_011014 [Aquatica leii]
MFRKPYANLTRQGKHNRRKIILQQESTNNRYKIQEKIAEDRSSLDVNAPQQTTSNDHISNLILNESDSNFETINDSEAIKTSVCVNIESQTPCNFKYTDSAFLELMEEKHLSSASSDDEYTWDSNECETIKNKLQDLAIRFKLSHVFITALLKLAHIKEELRAITLQMTTFNKEFLFLKRFIESFVMATKREFEVLKKILKELPLTAATGSTTTSNMSKREELKEVVDLLPLTTLEDLKSFEQFLIEENNSKLFIFNVMGVKVGPAARDYTALKDETRLQIADHRQRACSKEGRSSRRKASSAQQALFEEEEGALPSSKEAIGSEEANCDDVSEAGLDDNTATSHLQDVDLSLLKRQTKRPIYLQDYVLVAECVIPDGYNSAMQTEEAQEWHKAMHEEMES